MPINLSPPNIDRELCASRPALTERLKLKSTNSLATSPNAE